MGMERRYSAQRVATIAVGSPLVTWILLATTCLPVLLGIGWDHARNWFWLWSVLSVVALTLAASIPMFFAVEAFNRGVAEERWDKKSLDHLRETLERPIWAWLSILGGVVLTLIIVNLMSYSSAGHHLPNPPLGTVSYSFIGSYTYLVQFQTRSNLRAALLPKPIAGRGRAVWKPVISEHWGEH
jgi:hypothetical protein